MSRLGLYKVIYEDDRFLCMSKSGFWATWHVASLSEGQNFKIFLNFKYPHELMIPYRVAGWKASWALFCLDSHSYILLSLSKYLSVLVHKSYCFEVGLARQVSWVLNSLLNPLLARENVFAGFSLCTLWPGCVSPSPSLDSPLPMAPAPTPGCTLHPGTLHLIIPCPVEESNLGGTPAWLCLEWPQPSNGTHWTFCLFIELVCLQTGKTLRQKRLISVAVCLAQCELPHKLSRNI